MAGWSEPGRPIYRPLRRLLATFRRALRLDELDRRQHRRAWEDWANVRPGRPGREAGPFLSEELVFAAEDSGDGVVGEHVHDRLGEQAGDRQHR